MTSYLAYPNIDIKIFPDSYHSARDRFLALLDHPNLEVAGYHPYPCAGITPQGHALLTDTLWLGAQEAEKVLVLLAGTHGVEGFAGSAIELDHMDLIACRQLILPPGTAMLIVHALTPWGYAWLRRCGEDGVDLNRNAVDFSAPLPENAGYDTLRSALFCAGKAQRQAGFAEFERWHGRTALETAISSGQYNDPEGPFYGGNKPAHGRLVTEDLIRRYDLQGRTLGVIDLHTGLGPYGYGEIICDHQMSSPGVQVAQRWYGAAVTLPALGTSSSVPKTGLMDYIWHGIMTDNSCHVTLEFGSFSTDRLFEVLLRDHQIWSRKNNSSERLAHSEQMRNHFCPDDDAWRASVLFRARQVIAQALQGLSG